jgi:hypothetical protein
MTAQQEAKNLNAQSAMRKQRQHSQQQQQKAKQ